MFGFEELALNAIEIMLELVTLLEGFIVLSNDVV